ncbi:hypothetical protein G5I_08929 [Acromyrmex echinatior]|uniref:Uncharacterized protein n=1 Tax=Acromyrmex echinatior TaxID=103372 RepID=F4WSV2_ACREC|nr:hypothetical protein G5I_08929 [Acromyrmex echinatior]
MGVSEGTVEKLQHVAQFRGWRTFEVVTTSAQREGACIHVHNVSGVNAAAHSAAELFDPFESLERRALATHFCFNYRTAMVSYIYNFQLSFQLRVGLASLTTTVPSPDAFTHSSERGEEGKKKGTEKEGRMTMRDLIRECMLVIGPNTTDLLWRYWTILGPAPFHTLPPILSSFR